MNSTKVRLHWTRTEGMQPSRVVAYVTCLTYGIIHQQFCLSEAKQPFGKIATGCNLSQIVDDKFCLFRVWCKRTLNEFGFIHYRHHQ